MSIPRLLAVTIVVAATGCGGHTAETTSTTTRAMPASAPGRAHQAQGFDTETAAQRHCRADQVVWLNTNTKVYHEKGTAFYGRTKTGAYVCRKDADAAGDRDSKNGT